jgi:hypothetical protein
VSQDTERDQDGREPARVASPGDQPYHGHHYGKVPVEQHLWLHSLESGALALVATVLAGALLPASVPLWSVITIGLTLTAVLWYTSLRATGSLVMGAYLGAWGLLVTGWISAAHVIGVWRPYPADMFTGLLGAGVPLSALGAVAIGHHRSQIRRDHEKQRRSADVAPLRHWERVLARHGVSGVEVLDVIEHPGGQQIHGRLGAATDRERALTREALAAVAGPIAVSKRLEEGAVTFEKPKGGSAADFVMHVRTTRGKRDDVMLPRDTRPTSINRPMAIGELDNGRPFTMTFREITVMIVGMKGSGKSNTQAIFLANLARCIDAVIFMIDLKGGRMARPWMLPWVQGHAPRPVIDWLATTREEAMLMLEALLAGGVARASSGVGQWDKIVPTAEIPAIILVVDETAVMTGHQIRANGISNYNMAQLLAQIVETYRSEAIDELISALRSNVDTMGTTAVKSQSEVRFCLRVTSSAEGDSVFPDDHAAAKAVAQLANPGDCLVRSGPDLSPVVHVYRIGGEKQIADIALSTGAIRPVPEDRMIEAMGAAYAKRWSREHGLELLKSWRESAGIREPEQHAADDPFWGIVAQAEDPEKPLDPRRVKIRWYLYERGAQGYTVARLVGRLASEGLTCPRETVQRWLADDEVRGIVQRTGSPLHKWIWRTPVSPDDIPGMPDVK